ncbi:CoA transferase subunit A [Streptomyces sp. NPDC090493]|uniref:CoA transferase subunit A n=1 Tax=Streptomyces sp. NPDC090493 TaxID=3365964 RepID=UPI0037F7F64F
MTGSRPSKEIPLGEAGELIASKKSLSLASSQLVNSPMALIRSAIRAGASGLTVIPAVDASFAVDLMIAAGIVDTLIVSYVGFETLGLAPAFRAAAESGKITVVEADEPFIVHGTRAAASGLPFIPVRKVYEATDLPRRNPMLRTVTDPYTGETVTTIPPLRAEVCVLHAQEADPYGNVQMWAGNQQELDKAKAADTVIVSAERIVPVEKSRRDPRKVTVPGHLVDAVVHAPFGAHPTMSEGFYADDRAHTEEYVSTVRQGRPEAYLDAYVRAPTTHPDYLAAIGPERLASLMRED